MKGAASRSLWQPPSPLPPAPARSYLVGGAVRDHLLDLPPGERDWVVVGGTPEAMLAAGYRQADPEFPVFLHPVTGEEFALARRETKTGEGYRGFAVDAGPDVTLEEDLARRDLTINAMALDAEGRLVDPYGGEEDLAQGLLRHVTPAFVEDPVRLLRIARFAARFGPWGFRVAHATHRLLRRMVDEGAVEELDPRRIWRELHKALGYDQPWRFFEVMHAAGALERLLPGLAAQMGAGHGRQADAPALQALRAMAARDSAVVPRLGAWLVRLPDAPERAQQALGLPARLLADGTLARALWPQVARLDQADGAAAAALLDAMDAWRRDGRFERLLALFAAQPEAPARLADLEAARAAGQAVAARELQAQGLAGPALGEALGEARRAAAAARWEQA